MALGEAHFAKFVDGKQVRWDVSSLKTLTMCPHKYYLGTVEGWKFEKPGVATEFGKAVHDAYEVLDTYKFHGKPKGEAIEAALELLFDGYHDTLMASEANDKNFFTACRAVVWRADAQYDDNVIVADSGEKTPALEQRFEVEFPGTDVRFSGRVDKMATVGGELYCVDTKTTKSNLSSWYFDTFALDPQPLAYIWALRTIMGLPVKGFMIEATQTLVHNTRFGRQLYQISDAQVDEWLGETTYWLQQAEKFHEEGFWPRNFNGCTGYGGCAFRGVCSRSPHVRETILKSEYIQDPYGLRVTTGDSNEDDS